MEFEIEIFLFNSNKKYFNIILNSLIQYNFEICISNEILNKKFK